MDSEKTWTQYKAEEVNALEAKLALAESRVQQLEQANELDRRSLWSIVRAIDEEITGRMWLIEGRGSYEWDDDKYRQEFGWAIHALQEKLEPLRKIAHDLTNCPATEEGVNSVRKMEAENARLESRVQELTLALRNGCNGLELLLGEHKPERPDDPFDTINELHETVRKGRAILAAAEGEEQHG